MNSILRFRIPDDLKSVFLMQCESDGLTASLVMRKLIERYVVDNAQIDLFNKRGTKK